MHSKEKSYKQTGNVGVERRYLQSRCITFAHYAYRYRIGESVSVENDVLGLTLVDAKALLDKIH